MNKTIILLLAALCAVSVYGQTKKQQIAVYVTGGKEDGDNDVLSGKLTEAITKSESYVAVERTTDFLSQLQKEHSYQRSGNVDDNDIARLGKQSGAQYVCVAELMPVQGGDFITARLIDVERASVVASADGADKISNLNMLIRMTETIAQQLLNNVGENKSGMRKERVAVYVTGTDKDGTNKVLGAKLVSAITKSSEYVAMERTDAFLRQLNKEQDYQQSGNVDDNQLSKLGKQFGVRYVCAAKVSKSSYGGMFLKVSLIDVETAEVKATVNSELTNDDLNSLITTTQNIASKLLVTVKEMVTTWLCGYPNAADVVANLNKNILTISGKGAMNNFDEKASWAIKQNNITSIVIQNGVTSIGKMAFLNCKSLTSITIPNSVIVIGDWAFWNCKSLTSITIPNSVTIIGEYAFYNCESLTSITIPNSVTIIGKYAFYNCESLTSITIPNSVRTLYETFENCKKLTSLTVGSSVTKISNYTFYKCPALTSITILNYTPPIVDDGKLSDPFKYTLERKPTLYVPAASVGAYKKSNGWKNFKIVGI
jgi:TolB-like protein